MDGAANYKLENASRQMRFTTNVGPAVNVVLVAVKIPGDYLAKLTESVVDL